MASRKIKIAEQCSRCPREQERYVSLDEAITLAKQSAAAPPKKASEIYVDGELIASWEFLCDPCRNTVFNYVGSAAREMKKKSSSPVRKAKAKKEPEQAKQKPK